MKPHAGLNMNAGASPAIDGNDGFSSTFVRVAAGHYRFTLDSALAPNELVLLVTPREDVLGAQGIGVPVLTVGAVTTIEVKTWVSTAVADLDFNVAVFSLR